MDEYKSINYEATPKKTFTFSPFTLTEIQYLRGMVWYDKVANEYDVNPQITIDRKMSMHEFTTKILNKLDELENTYDFTFEDKLKELENEIEIMKNDKRF